MVFVGFSAHALYAHAQNSNLQQTTSIDETFASGPPQLSTEPANPQEID
jgi:hypothetical protein